MKCLRKEPQAHVLLRSYLKYDFSLAFSHKYIIVSHVRLILLDIMQDLKSFVSLITSNIY